MENKILEMMGQVLSEVKALSEKVSTLDEKVSTLDEKVSTLDEKVSTLDKKVSTLDKKVSTLELKQEESYQILKALEHSAQINKAEHDKMNNDIAHIKGDIASVKKDFIGLEIITSSNWNEIAKLKAVKQ